MKLIYLLPCSLVIVAALVALSPAQTTSSSASAKGAKTNAQAGLAGRPDAWRYQYHNNQWWYYHPNKTWSIWNGSAWISYNSPAPYTAGYRGKGSPGAFGATAGVTINGLPATDAVPGRSNPQMSGGGIGINGSAAGGSDGHAGLPNLSGGEITRGGSVGRGLSDTDALPGRLNPQMVGGGIGVKGSPLGAAAGTAGGASSLRAGAVNPGSNPSATDALPGEPDPQMAGGGLGVNGSVVGARNGTASPGNSAAAPAARAPSASGS